MVKLLFSVMCILMSVSGFAQEQIKIKHGPYLQNLKETEVTIVWLSDKPSIGWVEIAPDDGTSYYRTERIKFFDTVQWREECFGIACGTCHGPCSRY